MRGIDSPEFGPLKLHRVAVRSAIMDLWYCELRGDRVSLPCLCRRMLPPYSQGREYIRQFRDRSREVRAFEHPAINVPLYTNIEGDYPYLLLELPNGWMLLDLLRHWQATGLTVPPELAIKIVFPVSHALASAHARPGSPLVHGAVRPQAIWLTRAGKPLLGDFELGPLAEFDLKSADGYEELGCRVAPPELLSQSGHAGPPADVFGLAGVLLELLMVGRVRGDLLNRELSERLALLVAQGLPVPLLKFLALCLSELPEERPTMVDLTEQLRQFGAQMPRGQSLPDFLARNTPPLNALAQAPAGADAVIQLAESVPMQEFTTVYRPHSQETTPEKQKKNKEVRRSIIPTLLALVGILLAVAMGFTYPPIRDRIPGLNTHVLLRVDSIPSGAQVMLEDGSVLGLTPLTLQHHVGLSSTLTLSASRVGYKTSTLIRPIEDRGELDFQFELMPDDWQTGRAEIVTTPPGARLRINGQDRGISPATLEALPTHEEHRLEISLAGFQTQVRKFKVSPGETTQVDVALSPGRAAGSGAGRRAQDAGILAVRASQEAQVYLNGALRGTTRGELKLELRPGGYELELVSLETGTRASWNVRVLAGAGEVLEHDFAGNRWISRALESADEGEPGSPEAGFGE